MQDKVALLIQESTYSELSTNQKKVIDGDGTTGTSSPGGMAGDAFKIVGMWSQWLAQAGLTAIDDTLEPWLIDEVCLRAVRVLRPDRYEMFKNSRTETMKQALDAFSDTPVNAASNVDADAYALTLKSVRKYVVNYMRALEPPVFLPIEQIDQAAQIAVQRIWNCKNWSFKRREVVLSIDTSSNVTVSSGLGGGETMDELATLNLYYTDAGGENRRIEWADGDTMAYALSLASMSSGGRPRYFRTRGTGSSRVWKFFPTPDTTYTVRTEVFVSTPADFTTASLDTPLSLFPSDFVPVIRQAALAEAVRMTARPAGAALWMDVMQDVDRLLPMYEDQGTPNNMPSIRDTNGDVGLLTGNNWSLGGGL